MPRRRLPDFHGDPADRLIVATAMTLGIPLITADDKIIRWNDAQRMVHVSVIPALGGLTSLR